MPTIDFEQIADLARYGITAPEYMTDGATVQADDDAEEV